MTIPRVALIVLRFDCCCVVPFTIDRSWFAALHRNISDSEFRNTCSHSASSSAMILHARHTQDALARNLAGRCRNTRCRTASSTEPMDKGPPSPLETRSIRCDFAARKNDSAQTEQKLSTIVMQEWNFVHTCMFRNISLIAWHESNALPHIIARKTLDRLTGRQTERAR